MCCIRSDLDEFKEKSKKVQQEWATSSNGILSVSADALRTIEVHAREKMEKLEDKLLQLQGHLPPKYTDGSQSETASSEDGSDTSETDQDPFAHERSPHRPRMPTAPAYLGSASKGGKRLDRSSIGDSSASTALSDSIGELIRGRLDKNIPSPYFLPATKYRDPGEVQHVVERNDARNKRQSLKPETLSDASMAKSDKMTEHSESSYGCQNLDPNTMATEVRSHSTLSSSMSSFNQTSSGVGSAKHQESYGSREINDTTQQGKSEKTFQRSWVKINDSVSMPAQPSSSIRASPDVGGQPFNGFSTPMDLLIHPFQRTKRAVERPESAPVSKLKTKPGFSNISRAMKQQTSILGQPWPQEPVQNHEHLSTGSEYAQVTLNNMPQMTTSALGTNETVTGNDKEFERNTSKDTEDEDCKVRTNTMRDLSEYTDQELEAAQALIDMSRSGINFSNPQQQGVDHSHNGSLFPNETHPSEMPGASAHQDGAQYGNMQYGCPVYNAAAHCSSSNDNNTMPYGYASYGQGYTQQYGTAPPYGFSHLPGTMYAMGYHAGPVHTSYYHSSFQQGHQTDGHGHLSHIDQSSQPAASGSGSEGEEEPKFVRSQKATEQQDGTTAAMDRSAQANNDPFVG